MTAPEAGDPVVGPTVRPTVRLELAIDPARLPALRRLLPVRLGRAQPLRLVWHDGDDGALARAGLTLTHWRIGSTGGWTLDPLCRLPGHPTPLGLPAHPLATGAQPHLLDPAPIALPATPVPVLHFTGRIRRGTAPNGCAATLTEGLLGTDGGAQIAPTQLGRLVLDGPAGAVAACAQALAAGLGAVLPQRSLAGDARHLAVMPVPPPPLGAPVPPPGADPAGVFAHAVSHLVAVVLHHAPAAALCHHGEPVHQMRVALRRLRSIASLFRPVVGCPEVDALRESLKTLADLLGPAREWDVFLAGDGAAVARAFPGEPSLATLLAAAAARRDAAYDALAAWLGGPGLTALAIDAAILAQSHPWAHEPLPPDAPTTGAFETAMLERRLRRVVRRAANPAHLADAALHDLRLRAKRLRYAAEVFAPLHPERPARRFLRRLAALQEELGLLNDGVVADALMASLADAGGDGLAGGLVRGFAAGRAEGARGRIRRAWRRLRKTAPFWR